MGSRVELELSNNPDTSLDPSFTAFNLGHIPYRHPNRHRNRLTTKTNTDIKTVPVDSHDLGMPPVHGIHPFVHTDTGSVHNLLPQLLDTHAFYLPVCLRLIPMSSGTAANRLSPPVCRPLERLL